MFITLRRFLIPLLLIPLVAQARSNAVTFSFSLANNQENPFQREIFATILRPDGSSLTVPAFVDGTDRFTVRVFPGQRGVYRLQGVEERTGNGAVRPAFTPLGSPVFETTRAEADRFVRIDPANPLRFKRGAEAYIPIGANLPWPLGELAGYYPKHFRMFADQHLNWARLWMAHWAGMNLDWYATTRGPSPAPGTLSLEVAQAWDEIVDAAESNGIAIQWVLQHHGQYASTVNPNWDINPWNRANPGGFLENPGDFFTSKKARELTRAKYRYIVARWGYSPSVMAWELFNELHNTEPLRAAPLDHADVAAWHSEMADYLRAIDVHHHLVTTSFDDLESPVYSKMDYMQPHLYSPQMILAAQHLLLPKEKRMKPVFLGEVGDDQVEASETEKARGASLLPQVWASLMGDAEQPGQTWYVERLIQSGHLGELGAVAKFIEASGLARQGTLTSGSPTVRSRDTVPLMLPGTLWWHRHPAETIAIPADGRITPELALLPKAIAGSRVKATESGFPTGTTLTLDWPEPVNAILTLGPSGTPGAVAHILVNGAEVATHTWDPARAGQNGIQAPEAKVDIPLSLAPGRNVLSVQNPAGPDWFHFDKIQFAIEVPALASLGRQNKDFAMGWLWRRAPMSSAKTVGGVLVLDLAAGDWRCVWWDTQAGQEISHRSFTVRDGPVELPVPPVSTHVAYFLMRESTPR